ncbi:hypothetical protein FB451DRAFT_1485419 [Mycena latifolia]|nr:hypothetical protein FB451DRAFT_1485419 [Mycena latifolia]
MRLPRFIHRRVPFGLHERPKERTAPGARAFSSVFFFRLRLARARSSGLVQPGLQLQSLIVALNRVAFSWISICWRSYPGVRVSVRAGGTELRSSQRETHHFASRSASRLAPRAPQIRAPHRNRPDPRKKMDPRALMRIQPPTGCQDAEDADSILSCAWGPGTPAPAPTPTRGTFIHSLIPAWKRNGSATAYCTRRRRWWYTRARVTRALPDRVRGLRRGGHTKQTSPSPLKKGAERRGHSRPGTGEGRRRGRMRWMGSRTIAEMATYARYHDRDRERGQGQTHSRAGPHGRRVRQGGQAGGAAEWGAGRTLGKTREIAPHAEGGGGASEGGGCIAAVDERAGMHVPARVAHRVGRDATSRACGRRRVRHAGWRRRGVVPRDLPGREIAQNAVGAASPVLGPGSRGGRRSAPDTRAIDRGLHGHTGWILMRIRWRGAPGMHDGAAGASEWASWRAYCMMNTSVGGGSNGAAKKRGTPQQTGEQRRCGSERAKRKVGGHGFRRWPMLMYMRRRAALTFGVIAASMRAAPRRARCQRAARRDEREIEWDMRGTEGSGGQDPIVGASAQNTCRPQTNGAEMACRPGHVTHRASSPPPSCRADSVASSPGLCCYSPRICVSTFSASSSALDVYLQFATVSHSTPDPDFKLTKEHPDRLASFVFIL